MIGDSLSHNSLAGVAAGLAFGFNPILGAVMFSIVAAFGIEKIRKSFPKYSEIAIAVIGLNRYRGGQAIEVCGYNPS